MVCAHISKAINDFIFFCCYILKNIIRSYNINETKISDIKERFKLFSIATHEQQNLHEPPLSNIFESLPEAYIKQVNMVNMVDKLDK